MSPKKIGLVASGGGSKGAWQVGVLLFLAKSGMYNDGIHFVSGSSIGALFVSAIAMHPPSNRQLELAYKDLSSVWLNIDSSRDVWTKRWPQWLSGLWRRSIGKNEPLRDKFSKAFDQEMLRRSGVGWSVSSVDLMSGKLKRFDQDSKDLLKAAMASASFPVVFPPEEIDGRLYSDGGLLDYSPLSPAIKNNCDEIIVLSCSNPDHLVEVSKGSLKNSISIGLRSLSIIETDLLKQDIALCENINDNLSKSDDKRFVELNVIYPSKPLEGPLSFSSDLIRLQMRQGYNDAKNYFENKLLKK